MLDTNILILRRFVNPDELPDEMAISAITLAELSADPHQVRPDGEQTNYDEHAERDRRLDVLQRAEHGFDPIPFGSEAARAYGQVTAHLMIASTAIAPDSAGADVSTGVVGAPYRRRHGKAGISRRDKNMAKNQLPRWPATS
jgi:predicted nucleic acid-binding protein